MSTDMKKILDSNKIKMIAILAMTIDHIAWLLYPGYAKGFVPIVLHLIGRITCPVMCYFIAEGYHYTKSVRKYTHRLFIFALLSHFAYVFASADFADWKSFIPFYRGSALNQTSVMWALAWGLVMLRVVDGNRIKNNRMKAIVVVLICLISFPSDWSCVASLCILAFGTNRGNLKKQTMWMLLYTAIYAMVYFFAVDKIYGLLQMGVVLSVPIIGMYNGQRGKNQRINRFMKWLFYIYYPLHLLVIGWLRLVIPVPVEAAMTGLSESIVQDIDVGWNLGNTLDSYGDWITQYTDGKPEKFETAWGNPVTTEKMILAVKAAGFNAVRVPVTWGQHIDDSNGYKIDTDWMQRVKEVVDYVTDQDMYCILNMHHDTGADSWLKASDANIKLNSEKFVAVWSQIAEEFSEYDSRLLFEGFNEMLDEENSWVYPGKSAGDAVNKWNQLFVDTIRSSGGMNQIRCLIVNTYAAGTGEEQLADFVLPADTAEKALIVEVHYYLPWAYCAEASETGNRQSRWMENGGNALIEETLCSLYTHFTSKGIPVIIGEFGAANKDNEADRAEWAGYIVENAKRYGIKCFWWDSGGKIERDAECGYYKGMSIYDRYRNEWIFPELLKALK